MSYPLLVLTEPLPILELVLETGDWSWRLVLETGDWRLETGELVRETGDWGAGVPQRQCGSALSFGVGGGSVISPLFHVLR